MAFKTALVVDDSKSARFALRRFLENQYYKVDAAESAEECYSLLKQNRPDVIFLDHVMPGIDGFTALRQIKSDPAMAAVQVVICSSNEGSDFVRQAKECGATGVLHKPPSAEQLTEILNELSNPAEAPVPVPAPALVPAPGPAPSKVANIREPEVTIEQRVMKVLRNTFSSQPQPAPAPSSALNEAAQSLSIQIAQLQAQAVQLQTRIDEEKFAAQQQPDMDRLVAEVNSQAQRIAELEQLVDEHFSELHAALESGLRAQSERIDQIAASASEHAREEVERTMMSAAARISDQLASSILNALHNVSLNPLAPRNPAGPSLQETADRRTA
jgi:CheY-like chemotaxis protein